MRALMQIHPRCPQCGDVCQFDRTPDYVTGEEVPIHCRGCTWTGYAPGAMTIPPAPVVARGHRPGMMTQVDFPAAQVFVETGICQGHTLAEVASAHLWRDIYAIELDPVFAQAAMAEHRDHPHVHVIQGSSPDVLPTILDGEKTTVFWLDAHLSPAEGQWDASFLDHYGQCPLLAELQAIFAVTWRVPPIIFIDDVPFFCAPQYEYTIAEGLDRSQFPTREQIVAAFPPGWAIEQTPRWFRCWKPSAEEQERLRARQIESATTSHGRRGARGDLPESQGAASVHDTSTVA